MSIPLNRQQFNCFNCGLRRIGIIVTRELKNPENFLEGVLVISKYICLNCQTVLHQETVEINI